MLIYRISITGGGLLIPIASRCMVKKEWKELDDAIRQKVTPYLYNAGKGAMIPIAQMVLLRNRDRSARKFLPPIKELGEEVAFNCKTVKAVKYITVQIMNENKTSILHFDEIEFIEQSKFCAIWMK